MTKTVLYKSLQRVGGWCKPTADILGLTYHFRAGNPKAEWQVDVSRIDCVKAEELFDSAEWQL